MVIRILLAWALGMAWTANVQAKGEQAYQADLCAGWILEQRMPSGGRADCLSPDFAIEVDFSEKWHQAIGQSLYYASETGKRPAIILVCRKSERVCLGHALRLRSTISQWHLPITVFECGRRAQQIERDCRARPPG